MAEDVAEGTVGQSGYTHATAMEGSQTGTQVYSNLDTVHESPGGTYRIATRTGEAGRTTDLKRGSDW